MSEPQQPLLPARLYLENRLIQEGFPSEVARRAAVEEVVMLLERARQRAFAIREAEHK